MIGAGSPKREGGSRQQALADLQTNNEALLCMLERERQHSHQLQQRLQQVEVDALEVGQSSLIAPAPLAHQHTYHSPSGNTLPLTVTTAVGKQHQGCVQITRIRHAQ